MVAWKAIEWAVHWVACLDMMMDDMKDYFEVAGKAVMKVSRKVAY